MRKQLEFDPGNNEYSNNHTDYRKLDSIKDKINRKISNIRGSVNSIGASNLIDAITLDENSNPNTSQQVPSPYFEDEKEKNSRKLEAPPEIINKSALKKQKREKYFQLELRPINTDRLKPLKLETDKGYIKIREDSWVVVYLSK